jgi:hypothetical protein
MITEFLSALVLGGILGMVGQGMRVIVGMKKIYESLGVGEQFGTKMDWSRLSISLVIGFITGAFGMILKIDYDTVSTMIMTKDFMLSIIAIGYMGVDFIEGMMGSIASKFGSLPSPTGPHPSQPQYNSAPQTQPTAPANSTEGDNSFGAGIDDLPISDAPVQPTGKYNIPGNIPDSYTKQNNNIDNF